MMLNQSPIFDEDQSILVWLPNERSMYVVVGGKNEYGENRGYRIMPGTGVGSPAHLTMEDSSNLHQAAEWSKMDLFVTKQKDTEPRSASPANALDPQDPLVNFARFRDGESLVSEDLVIWFNLGMHHVPHTGDLPNTLMTTASSSVMLTPHNYLRHDRSRRLTNGVQIQLEKNGSFETTYFGTDHEPLTGFVASPQPVHKFPVDDFQLSL